MEDVLTTQLAALIPHALHALMVIILLVALRVNVFSAQKSLIVFHAKIIIQHNACFVKMVIMLKQLVLAVNVLKVVHYVPVHFFVR